jgi:hypothetical protein
MPFQDIYLAMVVAAFLLFGLALFGVSIWLQMKK